MPWIGQNQECQLSKGRKRLFMKHAITCSKRTDEKEERIRDKESFNQFCFVLITAKRHVSPPRTKALKCSLNLAAQRSTSR